jgi:hypothetical protein
MIVARERYLDGSSDLHVTLSLVTRTGLMHSLLSNLPESAREAVDDILVDALNRVQDVLKPHLVRHAARP